MGFTNETGLVVSEVNRRSKREQYEYEELAVWSNNIQSKEDVKRVIDKIDRIEHLLKAMDEFEKRSIDFAMANAYVYMKIVESGQIMSLGKEDRMIAEWLYDMSEKQRKQTIDMCLGGRTIRNVFRSERRRQEKEQSTESLYKEYTEDIVREFRLKGVVQIGSFEEKLANTEISSELKSALRDGVRHKLRSNGAYGIGDEKGTYIDVERAEDAVNDVIQTRLTSIKSDVTSIEKILEKSGKKPTFVSSSKGANGVYLGIEDFVFLYLKFKGTADYQFGTTLKHHQVISKLLFALDDPAARFYHDFCATTTQGTYKSMECAGYPDYVIKTAKWIRDSDTRMAECAVLIDEIFGGNK